MSFFSAQPLKRILGLARSLVIYRRPGRQRLLQALYRPFVNHGDLVWCSISAHADGFRTVRWEETITVPVTTLDDMIDQYGIPVFCKVDVEGFEVEVLAGLTRPIPALSCQWPGRYCLWRYLRQIDQRQAGLIIKEALARRRFPC